ncbi:hypothetical protein BCR43DRAFT_564707 [Syncephalastrum racemosum]|uniref:DDB1- and CUL4-associated factor 12 beta-propeller domain-containing protein n=1 Tax=Syncephalastrum racemosum TaxID=13706 RepID=A0A1X2HBC0_SYNRA|nr:hypothetical protein BCR43DRAFT_564707 [Syncephalastrum racemosum]
MRRTAPVSRALQRHQMEAVRSYVRPQLCLKHKIQEEMLQGHDKVFASVWIDDHQVLVGTKENKLIQLDLNSATARGLPLLPAIAPAGFAAEEDDIPAAICLKQPQALEPFTPPQPLSQRFFAKRSACEGVRSLALNPSQTLLAVATADPPAITLYSRDLQAARRTCHDQHTDAVFSVAWIDDTHLLSGSRDESYLKRAKDMRTLIDENPAAITPDTQKQYLNMSWKEFSNMLEKQKQKNQDAVISEDAIAEEEDTQRSTSASTSSGLTTPAVTDDDEDGQRWDAATGYQDRDHVPVNKESPSMKK